MSPGDDPRGHEVFRGDLRRFSAWKTQAAALAGAGGPGVCEACVPRSRSAMR
jgi:hypothetical protein